MDNPFIYGEIVPDERTFGQAAEAYLREVRVLAEVLEGLRDGTRTVIMTTHNLQEGLAGCDRAAIMVEGQLVFDQRVLDIDGSAFQQTYFSCVHDGVVET